MNQADSTVPVRTGIVLIATGKPYYINAAYNLCLSLKAQERDVPVMLITDSIFDMLTDTQKFWFDEVKRIPNLNPFQAKTLLYALSPFDRTLFLDVDMIWNPAKSLRECLNSLEGIPFTIANRGPIASEWDWGNGDEFRSHCAVPVVYNLSSEFIYFERSTQVQEFFTMASDFYVTNDIIRRRLGGFQPDEPSLSYGLAKSGLRPHVTPYYPCFWVSNHRNTFVGDKEIQDTYWTVSMGGAQIDERIVKLYKRYAAIAGAALGVTPLPYMQKRLLVKERATL